MNIANVVARFSCLSGLDKSDAYEWKSVIDDAVSYINSIIIKDELSDSDIIRIETLCAVYAYRLYILCGNDGISSFTAGDVKLTSSADAAQNAEKLWREYRNRYSDLVGAESFMFGAVKI